VNTRLAGLGSTSPTTPPAHERPKRAGQAVLVALVFTLASLVGTNPYQFGVGDNSITVPIVRAYADPRLYPGDFAVAQRHYYYTYLWKAVAWLVVHTAAPLHLLFLWGYAAALFATFLLVYALAMRLCRSPVVGVVALALLLFRRPTLGGIDTVESIFNTRELALPFVLAAFLAFLDRRRVWAFALLGIAYLVHPITVHPALLMLVVASLAEREPGGRRTLVAGLGVFALLASPILAWRLASSPPHLQLLAADPRWLVALRLRSSLHMFPSTFGLDVFVRAAATLLLIGLWWRWWSPSDGRDRRTVAAWTLTVLGVCVAGAVFAEVVPIGATFVTQPLRSFQLLECLAAIATAHLVTRGLETASLPRGAVRPLTAGLVLLCATPRALHSIAVFLVLAGLFAWLRSRHAAFALAACLTVAVAAAGIHAFDVRHDDPIVFSPVSAHDRWWLDAESWARQHTDRSDAFIVPADTDDDFRVFGERTVYADWEDGGLMNWNPAFGLEWMRRMRMLGFDGDTFRPLDAAQVGRIARELRRPGRAIYLVRAVDEADLGFRVRHRNAGFVISEVTPDPDRSGP